MAEITDPRLEYLFKGYFEGVSTRDEKDELLGLISDAQYDDQLKNLMDRVWTRLSQAYRLDNEQSERILSGILPFLAPEMPVVRAFRMRIIRWSTVAAVLLILLSAGWRWYKNNGEEKAATKSRVIARSGNDVAPGGNKALLILGNGLSVALDSVHNGVVARQGGIPIVKFNGQLSYGRRQDGHIEEMYNTIVTPRGGQYHVILPDGSKVWLNAASSLRFPTVFTGTEREVTLTGEAYFEVAKDKNMPFKVNVKGMEVTVLGTRFDIMAYNDEPAVKTTLLEGSVRVSKGNEQVRLKPGQQASVSHADSSHIEVNTADIQVAIAWKNGLFLFHNTDISSVIREIARWYDTDVTYEGNVSAHLNGMISRNTNLSQVFRMLEVTSDIDFSIQDKKIIIRAKN